MITYFVSKVKISEVNVRGTQLYILYNYHLQGATCEFHIAEVAKIQVGGTPKQ